METIAFANIKILLWDLKLTVRFDWSEIFFSMQFLKYFLENKVLISENLKETPLDMAWAVSPQ